MTADEFEAEREPIVIVFIVGLVQQIWQRAVSLNGNSESLLFNVPEKRWSKRYLFVCQIWFLYCL
jgi:hypothetical protein